MDAKLQENVEKAMAWAKKYDDVEFNFFIIKFKI